jgi:5-methylcytosine-specific restriction endonuclease McrA
LEVTLWAKKHPFFADTSLFFLSVRTDALQKMPCVNKKLMLFISKSDLQTSSKTYIPKTTQNRLDKLAKGCCEYCKQLQKYLTSKLQNEHIQPQTLGGTSDLDNLAKACEACNNSKHTATSAFDPVTNQIVPLYHPRKDNWQDHFKWSTDLLRMEGLTSTGRATIIRLKTNREAHINIRRVTIGKGHPPD